MQGFPIREALFSLPLRNRSLACTFVGVGFLYPLFLLSALALAIPIAIHLFDLRRFRKVVFPATRFLKEVALQSRQQSKIRQKLLLALRCLFLLSLVLAFAQPFWGKSNPNKSKEIQVVVVDNGPATGARKEGRMLLENSKDAALRVVQSGAAQTYLLSATGPLGYAPLSQAEAKVAISALRPEAVRRNSESLLAAIQGMIAEEGADRAQVYWISDFPKSHFSLSPDTVLLQKIVFHGVVMPAGNTENIWIDTAWALPQTDPAAEGRLVVRTRSTLPANTAATTSVRLTSNGRFQSSTPARNAASGTHTDTLSYAGQGSSWQQLELSINSTDGPSFDDTFRIAVRPLKPLPVLVIAQGAQGVYLQAALQASGRFVITEASAGSTLQKPEQYALIVLTGITSLSTETLNALKPAVARGVPLMMFPGKTNDYAALENSLRSFADLRIKGMDTSMQTASSLQVQNPLINEIFESTPPNMELPAAAWHYRVESGYAAQGQSILAFRNGNPLLAEYSTGSGKMYLLTTAADAGSGSFVRSYFFATILHAAAVSAAGAASVSYTLGSEKAVFIPRAATGGTREVVRMTGSGVEVIPPQRPAAGGIDLYPDGVVSQAGFYRLSGADADTMYLGLNAGRQESLGAHWALSELKNGWKEQSAEWTTAENLRTKGISTPQSKYPLWKISVILALLLLAAETAVLLRSRVPVRPSLSPQQ